MSGLLAAPPSRAAGVEVEIDRVVYADWTVQDLRAEHHAADVRSGAKARLRLRLGQVQMDGAAAWRDVDWQCEWQQQPLRGCAGSLTVAGGALGELELRQLPDWKLLWSQGRGRAAVAATANTDGSSDLRADFTHMPVDWLLPLLRTLLPQLSRLQGTLDGSVHYTVDSGQLRGRLQLLDGGLDSDDGSAAIAGLAGDFELQRAPNADGSSAASVDAQLRSGDLLWTSWYAELAAGSHARVQAISAQSGELQRISAQFTEPAGVRAEVQGQLRSGQPSVWEIKAETADLARTTSRYLQSGLAALGFPDIQLAGALRLSANVSGDGIQAASLQLDNLAVVDGAGRFAMQEASGALHWAADGSAAQTRMRWGQAAIHGISLGAAELRADAEAAGWRLAAPLRLQPLGGVWSIDSALIDPRREALALAMTIEQIDLAELAARFAWPAFTGKLSGRLPSASYREGVLAFDGGLQMKIFDGAVDIDGLRLERPFGVAPTLSADVALQDLDLVPLTSVFGFGEISGRLDGRIAGLRLVDWKPAAFDAELHTDTAWRGKRRISQRAVQDLSSVGGGLVAGLQNQVLRVFDSFSYRQIGLRCRLENNICHMGGVDSASTGYTIVEGSGLPRITVKGFQQRVDWPVLLARLQAATAGRGIRVE